MSAEREACVCQPEHERGCRTRSGGRRPAQTSATAPACVAGNSPAPRRSGCRGDEQASGHHGENRPPRSRLGTPTSFPPRLCSGAKKRPRALATHPRRSLRSSMRSGADVRTNRFGLGGVRRRKALTVEGGGSLGRTFLILWTLWSVWFLPSALGEQSTAPRVLHGIPDAQAVGGKAFSHSLPDSAFAGTVHRWRVSSRNTLPVVSVLHEKISKCQPTRAQLARIKVAAITHARCRYVQVVAESCTNGSDNKTKAFST